MQSVSLLVHLFFLLPYVLWAQSDLNNEVQEARFSCANDGYLFLKRTEGIWQVKTKDRTSPGNYEANSGKAVIGPSIEGCGVAISFRGTYKNKPYAREMNIMALDSINMQMVSVDSEHGSYSLLEGAIIDSKTMELYWYRDHNKKRVQSKYVMLLLDKEAFEFSSYLSTDYGERWALTHERFYSRKYKE